LEKHSWYAHFYIVLIEAWDIFYLGTCYEEAFDPEEYDPEKADEVFVDIPSDKETLDVEIYAWVDTIYEKYYNDTVPRRLIVKGKNPVCTHGYALTNRGARKLLLEMNEWLPFPVDITMIHYISEGRFKAYSVMPPLFVQWRNTHDPRKNSDIEGSGIELARNWGFWRSARKHLVDWYVTLLIYANWKGHFWCNWIQVVGWSTKTYRLVRTSPWSCNIWKSWS